MKKLFIIVLALTLTLSGFSFSFADNKDTNIIINGQPIQFTDETGYPFIDSANRTQVPLRAAMEAYGCTVGWDQKTKTASIEKDGITVTVPVGEGYIYRNGKQVPNDTAAVIINGRTYLPIRIVLESVGANVGWDGKSVVVSSGAGESGGVNESIVENINTNTNKTTNTISYEEFMNHFDVEVIHFSSDYSDAQDMIELKFKALTKEEGKKLLDSLGNELLNQYCNKMMSDNYTIGSEEVHMNFYVDELHPLNVVSNCRKMFYQFDGHERNVENLNKLDLVWTPPRY